MDKEFYSGIAAFVFGGGAVALVWKPVSSVLVSLVTNSRAGGEIITSYKEQVMLLNEANELLRKENDDLRNRHDIQIRRISSLETDLRLIKNSLSILLAMTEVDKDDKFRSEVNRLISNLKDGSHDYEQRE